MQLSRDELLEFVQPHLTKTRYEHTVRVADTALILASRFGSNPKKTEIAAILHDYAKYKSKEDMKRWIIADRRLSKDLLHHHHEIWHGPVGAIMLEQEIGLQDSAIQSAIASHTSGKKNMSTMDKIVFLADYIEPGRGFPGVEEVRKTAETNLDAACLQALSNTIQFLTNKSRSVYPDTIHAYNDLLTNIENLREENDGE
ncbi:bis(5'-nucleosyl)-tetraphosphatase (symmetrical) YqeK [Halobacillus shinanisalinarum]|uniref:bis(5'-nucleosyl)-tetraphosphatase (symmetrical) n=1 Tax=Halobacillus shinanisalinarum TaxID=2932258 RepID=A0ABY4H0B8_9BACI|nr:bis(5'-nucleosyl)-tetraphosphatase (symmetrical) YqeK [Halobacillus shinanisalinarum]UOQ93803.1 bis(5'-nucleosyl)-tetraphosphatase (symmetrical) YqeK [Halobacillus shinanisalinarum]